MEEVKAAIFGLNGNSSSGPDGFTGMFYKECWEIICNNIHNIVLHFFGGAALPKSITHTNLVMLPKKQRSESFSDLRPISLSNFINKEIVTDIRKRGKPANVVIKLDISKAYDRVSWKYLIQVLRKMGFAEHFITLTWNLLSNNWYSVLVNGQSSGFFKSTRGVKQGDPLSTALFILSVEVLSRSLNRLFEDESFWGFGMPEWTEHLNHLAYADDTIIFTSAHQPSFMKIMTVLRSYEQISDQQINRAKSSYHMHVNAANALIQKVEDIAGFTRILSSGGKATLITSVLQSMPVYLLSILDPPQNILKHLHKIFARFFWSNKEEGRSRHWASWQKLCTPKEEGGLSFRSLNDVSKSLFAKLWWRFRTAKSLWSNYMLNKYCKKEIRTEVQFKQGSHVWKQMLNAREQLEHEILWEMKNGTTNIWHENWTGLGALYHVLPPDFSIEENLQEVAEQSQGREWNGTLIDQNFPEGIAEHIKKIHYDSREEQWDKQYWMPISSGKFTINSAWQILRHRVNPNQEFRKMWTEGPPFKISFFLWRLWRHKLSTNDLWRK
nr:uncharacterized protein LOC104108129 [Nicotiana tomentosiformis]